MPANSGLSLRDQDLRSVRDPSDVPDVFNMAAALVDRHVLAGDGARVALRGPAGTLTYQDLLELVNRTGNALRSLGIGHEQRVLILLRDSPEFAAAYLAAMKIGAVPCALNTFANPKEYEYYVRHSRAAAVIGEAEFLEPIEPMLRQFPLRVISVRGEGIRGALSFNELIRAQSAELDPAATLKDEMSHWVYTSGSTGNPKAAVHLHKNTIFSVDPYVRHVLQMTPEDITFSVSRMFFSYGLTNSMFMPLWVGASSVLVPARPEPEITLDIIQQYRPTLFFSVPTSYGRLLRGPLDPEKLRSLRLCVSAGEALPSPIYLEWKSRTGLETLDGVGSTEFGYIFLSNCPGNIHPDSSGIVLPDHKSRLVNAEGNEAVAGELGELWISSPSIAALYWANQEKSRRTFIGEWLRTGDQYSRDERGVLVYNGRSDDLFKCGGMWVSPIQIESTLLASPAVAEVSVIAEKDAVGLEKPVAYLVLKAGFEPNGETEQSLRQFAKERLSSYKCPRSFYFVPELPKTATGKIQRYKLRERAVAAK